MWAVDFQFDSTTDGRPIKIVSIVDEHTRECLGGMVERSITGEHLIGELDHLATERGHFRWCFGATTDPISLQGDGRLVGRPGWPASSPRTVSCTRWRRGWIGCTSKPDAK